ncbi:MAG: hypothetical protein MZV64_44335 [Ignavibacteriales bacterium]|nr:hypothetical protein [Ignavibacteriales bacterium]
MPLATPRLERPPALGGQRVEAAAAVAGPLDPAALDPGTVLHPVEGRVERRDRQVDQPARFQPDRLADLVAVERSVVERREDQELDAAALQVGIEHARLRFRRPRRGRHASPVDTSPVVTSSR